MLGGWLLIAYVLSATEPVLGGVLWSYFGISVEEIKKDVNFGTIQGFDIISKSILDLFNVEPCEQSLFKSLIQ